MDNTKRLLLVTDEGYVTDRVQEILKGFPQFSVAHAATGEEARELLKESAFDAVITDIYVRGVSGLELLHHAKEKNKDVCVIIITGVDNADLAAKALKEGAFDFVIKPPALDRISNILKLVALVKA
ncbi:MAG: response regulator [Elusimicrobiales bacterium]|jgi:DNA-binding NtrC family response regulator